jgi:hypothetical protein
MGEAAEEGEGEEGEEEGGRKEGEGHARLLEK